MVQRAAARRAAEVGQRDTDAGGAEDADDRGVDGPLPGVHDAAGEEPDVVAGGLQRLRIEAGGGAGGTVLGTRCSALRDGEDTREPATRRRWWRERRA